MDINNIDIDKLLGILDCNAETNSTAAEVIRYLRIENETLKQSKHHRMLGTAVYYKKPGAPNIRQAIQRDRDEWGGGGFGDGRGTRDHSGIDYLMPAGSGLRSTVTGIVTKCGIVYSDDLSFRYVEVTDAQGNHIRHHYVFPDVQVGQAVKREQLLGTTQDLQHRYPADKKHKEPMPNHLHLEVLAKGYEPGNKTFIDPNSYHFA